MVWNSLSRGTEEENALNAQPLSFALGKIFDKKKKKEEKTLRERVSISYSIFFYSHI